MGAKIKGGLEMKLRLGKVFKEFLPEVGDALFRRAEKIMAISKDQYVPVLTGDLKASGKVEGPEITKTKIKVSLEYPLHYATKQHERLDFHHSIGQAKFLEIPLNEAKSTLIKDISEELKL